MAIYSLGVRTASLVNGAAFEIVTNATDRAYVLEIGFTCVNGAQRMVGLGRSAVAGIGGNAVAFQAEDFASPAAVSVCNISWSGPIDAGPPSMPRYFLRRVSLVNVNSNIVIWRFPEGLVIPVNGSLGLFQIGPSVTLDAWVVIDE